MIEKFTHLASVFGIKILLFWSFAFVWGSQANLEIYSVATFPSVNSYPPGAFLRSLKASCWTSPCWLWILIEEIDEATLIENCWLLLFRPVFSLLLGGEGLCLEGFDRLWWLCFQCWAILGFRLFSAQSKRL